MKGECFIFNLNLGVQSQVLKGVAQNDADNEKRKKDMCAGFFRANNQNTKKPEGEGDAEAEAVAGPDPSKQTAEEKQNCLLEYEKKCMAISSRLDAANRARMTVHKNAKVERATLLWRKHPLLNQNGTIKRYCYMMQLGLWGTNQAYSCVTSITLKKNDQPTIFYDASELIYIDERKKGLLHDFFTRINNTIQGKNIKADLMMDADGLHLFLNLTSFFRTHEETHELRIDFMASNQCLWIPRNINEAQAWLVRQKRIWDFADMIVPRQQFTSMPPKRKEMLQYIRKARDQANQINNHIIDNTGRKSIDDMKPSDLEKYFLNVGISDYATGLRIIGGHFYADSSTYIKTDAY